MHGHFLQEAVQICEPIFVGYPQPPSLYKPFFSYIRAFRGQIPCTPLPWVVTPMVLFPICFAVTFSAGDCKAEIEWNDVYNSACPLFCHVSRHEPCALFISVWWA